MSDMTKISFYSSIGNGNNSVKVSLHKPINSGSQAQVYHGCYYDPSSKENKCVAVKLLGTGTRKTQYNTQDTVKKQKKLFKSLSSKDNSQLSLKDLLLKEEIEKNIKSEEKSRSKMLESIVEDSMNEISLLKKFQEKFENQKSPKHIIGMYDGGSIIKIHGDRDEEQIYSYIIIMELGTETFQDKMISIAKNYIEKDEEKLMNTLMDPAHVLSRIHQVAIHMDFKPKNMVYVPSQNGDILKAIDFGGSLLLNGQRPSMWNDKISNVEGNINIKNKTNVEQKNNIVEKITCTRQYLPPELDNRYLIEQSNLNNIAIKKLNASTKSDVWMFGIMCCELFLYIKYISIEKNIECLKKTINKKLLRINDLYKWKNELLEQDKLNKIENYNKISNSLGINDENIEVHRTSTSQHDPYSLQPSISDLQNEINDMLELKRDYPRFFN
ncbi:Protein kinase domain-containing protein [Meloidogyne graminicola]|uniref:Protein kinase domain-containing protein n=1 Tax=Meloidogyne graminicola TaxID=189291 RepID=A0A8S9ZFB8_9BILA|nr:Protein kinase domain-containing protein [Meloidogyne graminicola]